MKIQHILHELGSRGHRRSSANARVRPIAESTTRLVRERMGLYNLD